MACPWIMKMRVVVCVVIVVVVGMPMLGYGKDPCSGGTSSVVRKMAKCLPAAKDPSVAVDRSCCALIEQMCDDPACLCSCVTSRIAKYMGVKPLVALSIPMRCNITSRPIGYHCAGGTVP